MRPRFVATLGVALTTLATPALWATGTWNGQNTLHVPTSWCIVQGSRAQTAPNIAGDTATDDLIWRRHERPTDSIYVNQAGITFRSAINNAWTTLDFPIIADPNTTLGVQGDLRGENVNAGASQVEFNALINSCDQAYNNIGRAGIGITMVNANMFHDGTGAYIGIVGWGGCNEFPAGTCTTPYDGRVVLVDNAFLHPSSPDRTWPDGNGPFGVTDPIDIDAGHEMGHALSLDHRNGSTNLMNPILSDNNADGMIDNIALNAAEVTALRANAMNVPGLEQDPPNVIIPAHVVAHRIPDKISEEKGVPAYLDIASLRATYDEKKKEFGLTTQLSGLLPPKAAGQTYWFLVDRDGPASGLKPEQLAELGLRDVKFTGADLVARAEVRGKAIRGSLWAYRDGQVVQVTQGFTFELQTLVMHPLYIERPKGGKLLGPVATNNLIALKLSNDLVRVEMGTSLRAQTTAGVRGKPVADVLDGEGGKFILERPSFPHCFPANDVPPGGTVDVKLEGLKPSAPIHGFLGPRLIFRGETDGEGGGVVRLEIPRDTTYGLHLVTVGIDKTALTADCVVNVVQK
jgi:hypothetical protein